MPRDVDDDAAAAFGMFRNPHLLERCFCTHSSSCFHGDATPISASLQGQRVRFLENLLCFKRTHQGTGVEHSFGTALGGEQRDFVDKTAEVQRCIAAASLGTKSPMRASTPVALETCFGLFSSMDSPPVSLRRSTGRD